MENIILKESDEWITPDEIFKPLEQEFGPFDLDAAANYNNTKAKYWFGKQAKYGHFIDALSEDWTKFNSIWCNPPYSKEGNKDGFIKKAFEVSQTGSRVIMLLPVKTDTASFHDYIYNNENAGIRFLRGRIRFLNQYGIKQMTGRFASMVVVF